MKSQIKQKPKRNNKKEKQEERICYLEERKKRQR